MSDLSVTNNRRFVEWSISTFKQTFANPEVCCNVLLLHLKYTIARRSLKSAEACSFAGSFFRLKCLEPHWENIYKKSYWSASISVLYWYIISLCLLKKTREISHACFVSLSVVYA